MQDFPPNSHKAQATEAPREAPKPVTSAQTRERKPGLGRKFKQTFFGGTGRGAAEHAVSDVVVPGIRDMFYEAMRSGLDHLFYGDPNGGRRRTTAPSSAVNQNLGHFAYESITKPTRAATQQTRTLSRQSRSRHSLAELVIPTRDEAHDVIDRMNDILSQSGDVTVADLYVLTGVRPDHTDNKWGWYSLKGAKAVRLRQGGWLLDLPEPEPLNG